MLIKRWPALARVIHRRHIMVNSSLVLDLKLICRGKMERQRRETAIREQLRMCKFVLQLSRRHMNKEKNNEILEGKSIDSHMAGIVAVKVVL
jgi:hypothetical protein